MPVQITEEMRDVFRNMKDGFTIGNEGEATTLTIDGGFVDEAIEKIIKIHETNKQKIEFFQPNLAILQQAVAVAITGLYAYYPEDVLRTFNISELQSVVDITEPLRHQHHQVEDIYKRAWDILNTPPRTKDSQTAKIAIGNFSQANDGDSGKR